MEHPLPFRAIDAARSRIAPFVRHTPLMPLPALRSDFHPNLRLKLENLQVAGSFKVRGVFNHLLQLDVAQRERGVIAASGGNHGLALAYAAWRLGIPAVVYLPARASADRERRIAAWGARIFRHGDAWDDAHRRALEHAAAEGLYYVHPFDDIRTLEGQGTLGLEVLVDAPCIDLALIAVGGGGLIGGVAAALKQARPGICIVGVEPIGAPTMTVSLNAGRLVELPAVHSIADTLSPRALSERTLDLALRYVDDVALVTDEQMVEAMRWLWTECNQLVEPAGAAVIAALQSGTVDATRYAAPVAVICGGNVDAGCVFEQYTAG
ncbi:threonine ammonia-lyase [Roseiflexus castenholzii]|uniref:threonine ammonia-lyase n=1 Tax=Roseiflexus castenholzii (strain DSM 13941 / HLO8) TaxID=383372 RepID=A7NJI1_ROSCS|nr:threonine/serine dehydratase [Roseiflexus castenholzii]ABU57651.1 Pyridoxal-5'-phosphate-dependent protein beta subunit [Roseiflexus castenholzii DSM 13941]